MIRLGKEVFSTEMFNDGTFRLQLSPQMVEKLKQPPAQYIPTIVWQYESIQEQIVLQNLVWHLREMWKVENINLFLPYVPNARMDRVERPLIEIHTLKWFARVINELSFDHVIAVDVHSITAYTLIDRLVELPIERFISWAIRASGADILACPDFGAVKRYRIFLEHTFCPYFYFQKDRDWQTREITELKPCNNSGDQLSADALKDKTVLVIDDIVAEGNTVSKLYQYLTPAKKACIYCTHLEPTVFRNTQLFKQYDKIYTTDSMVRKQTSEQIVSCQLFDTDGWNGVFPLNNYCGPFTIA